MSGVEHRSVEIKFDPQVVVLRNKYQVRQEHLSVY